MGSLAGKPARAAFREFIRHPWPDAIGNESCLLVPQVELESTTKCISITCKAADDDKSRRNQACANKRNAIRAQSTPALLCTARSFVPFYRSLTKYGTRTQIHHGQPSPVTGYLGDKELASLKRQQVLCDLFH